MINLINIDYRKVGGMRFLKIGRLNLSWSISDQFKPIGADRILREELRMRRLVERKRRESKLVGDAFTSGLVYAAKRWSGSDSQASGSV
jgi:hypothetical protein